MTTCTRWLMLATLPAGLAMSLGCAKTVGDTLAGTANKFILPTVMELGDVGMGCASGEGLGGTIIAYGPYSKKADRVGVMIHLSAAMCMDAVVWEARLESARAVHRGDMAGAKDAKAREGQAHLVAARRYLAAHQTLQSTYGVPEPGEDCPKLKHESDQLAYLLGLSAGMLAVLHDLGADGQGGVPLSLPAGIMRGADCLDDDAWWGAPRAMKAAVWALQPDAPGAEDAWVTFDESFAKGRAANVRLAGAFHAQTAALIGDEARTKAAIAAHAAAIAEGPGDPKWRMLDVYATELVAFESDKIWTRAVGHRTPFGELGTFPGAPVEEAPVDESFLEDLLGD